MTGQYFTAAICTKGHVATEATGVSARRHRDTYCRDLRRARVISVACPNCQTPIRGYFHVPGVLTTAPYHAPAHCFECGTAFPWTAEKVAAARDYRAHPGARSLRVRQRTRLNFNYRFMWPLNGLGVAYGTVPQVKPLEQSRSHISSKAIDRRANSERRESAPSIGQHRLLLRKPRTTIT